MTNIAIANPMIVKMHAPTPIIPPTDKDIFSDEKYDLIEFSASEKNKFQIIFLIFYFKNKSVV